MITRMKNSLLGAAKGWRLHPPVSGRSWRPSWLAPDYPLHPEAGLHPHSDEEKAKLFMAADPGSTEIETLNWLHATVCLTKASSLLETGSAMGLGTIALASACRDNGFGKVHSIEIDPGLCEQISLTLKQHGLADYAEMHCMDSRDFLRTTNLVFDFGFFDSLCELRAEEYEICLDRGILRGVAAFHDTSPYRPRSMPQCSPSVHEDYRARLEKLADDARCSGHFENILSRGLFVIFPKQAI